MTTTHDDCLQYQLKTLGTFTISGTNKSWKINKQSYQKPLHHLNHRAPQGSTCSTWLHLAPHGSTTSLEYKYRPSTCAVAQFFPSSCASLLVPRWHYGWYCIW